MMKFSRLTSPGFQSLLRFGPPSLLALGLTFCGIPPPAWSVVVRMAPIHPAPLKYSASSLSGSHLGRAGTLSASEAFGSRPFDRLLKRDATAPSLADLGLASPESQPVFRLNQPLVPGVKVQPAAAEPHPALRAYYAPAADMARTRSTAAGYVADYARDDYNENVGATVPAYPLRDAHFSADARQASGQLVNRLLLAVFESAKKPSPLVFDKPHTFFTVVSTEGIRNDLVKALASSASLGSRPVGQRVWGDLLTQDFPVEVYQPRVRVMATSDPAVVDYQVDSWPLPSTRTPVYVGAYADNAYASYQRTKELLNSLPPKGQTLPRSWLDDFPIKYP